MWACQLGHVTGPLECPARTVLVPQRVGWGQGCLPQFQPESYASASIPAFLGSEQAVWLTLAAIIIEVIYLKGRQMRNREADRKSFNPRVAPPDARDS